MADPSRTPAGTGPRRRPRICALAFVGLLGLSIEVAEAAPPTSAPAPDEDAPDEASPPEGETGDAETGDATPEPDPPPTWRFRDADRKVKVISLAGSVGAWPKGPYSEHFERMCQNVEVRNISKTGAGAAALKSHFRRQVIENGYLQFGDETQEFWVVFQGGLNSIAMPEMTNRHIKDIFVLAHRRGINVVGLGPTPWGDDSDKRWQGGRGLDYWHNTRKVVSFITKKAAPREALGRYVSTRSDPEADWDPSELADVGIDLYDSALRDRDAPLRDLDAMRKALETDSSWKKKTAENSELARAMILEFEAFAASLMPRWYLRAELRSFDDIHPNADGHRLIAEIACPWLPPSWGCSCPPPP